MSDERRNFGTKNQFEEASNGHGRVILWQIGSPSSDPDLDTLADHV